jgi:hypothetical protein
MADRLRSCCGSPAPFGLLLGQGGSGATSRIGRSIMITTLFKVPALSVSKPTIGSENEWSNVF